MVALDLMSVEPIALGDPRLDSFFDVFVSIDCGGNTNVSPPSAPFAPGGPPAMFTITGNQLSEDFTTSTPGFTGLPSTFIPDPNDPPVRPFDENFPGTTTITVIEIPAPTPEDGMTPTPEDGIVPTPDRFSVAGIGMDKFTVPAGAPDVFDFTFSGPGGVVPFGLADGGMQDFFLLDPGLYTVTETVLPG